ncbi:aldose-1-epimerase protein [Pseudovibrio sp. JE062]|nr:aldose-1-epimerase protein [Pseudovibrio sp. JE062]
MKGKAVAIRDFGELENRETVKEVTLHGGDLTASILTYGATVRRLQLGDRDLTLGFDNLRDYELHSPHMGATAGRCANRITNGCFSIGDDEFQLSVNEGGRHHLHGGHTGFAHRIWTIEEASEDSVLLSLESPDGEEGYPGTVQITCRYTLTKDNTLRIEFSGSTDKPTLLNPAHHSYFNLGDHEDVTKHQVMIPARSYLPVSDELIPTGEIVDVAGTAYDFREMRQIQDEQDNRFDNNFCLRQFRLEKPELSAVVFEPETQIKMEVWSTEPGIQFYDGSSLNTPVPGFNGKNYGPRAGLCLEPQCWPDSPNHEEFACSTLQPTEHYLQITEYRFI